MKKKWLTFIIFLVCLMVVTAETTNIIALSDDTNTAIYNITSYERGAVAGLTTTFYDEYGTCQNESIHVTILQQNCDINNYKTKVVSWAVANSTGDGYVNQSVAKICADYEKNHPGWIVTGGINADQYTLGNGNGLGTDGKHPYTVQPYYPMVCDNEKWFSNTWMDSGNGSTGRFVGFTNDGTSDSLVMVNASSAETQLTLQILDAEENIVKTYLVNSFNGEGETVIYSGFYSDTSFGTFLSKDCAGTNLFIVENAEQAYCNNSSTYTNVEQAQDAFYGKGTITKKATSTTLSKGQFAISTTNPELLADLNTGVTVRCQYEYVNELYNSFESTIGFHTVQIIDGVDQAVSGSYNLNSRPRSIFGRKNNGAVVLLTIDDYNDTYGVTGYGINAICKTYGLSEAYQMDGGGSAQMAVRQDDGTFKGVTYSADYSGANQVVTNQRSVLSALLFVVRDPSIVEEYTCKYELDGGTYTGVDLTFTYTSYSDLVLPDLEKEGYVFDRWYLDPTFETKVDKKVTGNITVYAKFYYLGDADNNKELDLIDCILLRMYYSGVLTRTNYIEMIFDVNQDDVVSEKDILSLQEKIIE